MLSSAQLVTLANMLGRYERRGCDPEILIPEEAAAIRAVLDVHKPPTGEFVTVRAAVVIRELANGGHSWSIRGRSDLSDRVAMSDAIDYLDENIHSTAFITARVPIVKPVEVEGEVEP